MKIAQSFYSRIGRFFGGRFPADSQREHVGQSRRSAVGVCEVAPSYICDIRMPVLANVALALSECVL